jgi:hypothetical protein
MPDSSVEASAAPASPIVPNVDRLNKVADLIQQNPEHFHMGHWFGTLSGPHFAPHPALLDEAHNRREGAVVAAVDLFECGTTACIAGWACHLWEAEVDPTARIENNAARILGLDFSAADDLFYAFDLNTPDAAADRLRRMALDAERDQFGDAGAHDATADGSGKP